MHGRFSKRTTSVPKKVCVADDYKESTFILSLSFRVTAPRYKAVKPPNYQLQRMIVRPEVV